MKDYFGYHGKKCIVTGAATGMGQAGVEMLLDLGAEVYTLDVKEVDAPVKKALKVDLSDKAAIDEAFELLPEKFDKFFGFAGVGGVREDFVLTVKVNFLANKYITDEYLTKRIHPGGAIAYISSVGGIGWLEHQNEFKDVVVAQSYEEALRLIEAKKTLKGMLPPGMLGYVFAKRALIYYAKSMVSKFAENSIRINTVSPGITQTPLLENDWMPAFGAQGIEAGNLGAVARYAQPYEMGQPIVFLNSDMASYISGEDLKVDYGLKAMRDIMSPNGLAYAGSGPTLEG
ncbi:MAG: SDR family oxidoreductase [Anaerolineales bacterium]|nr:SDR family oxidoreductase [Anaerolineales bacterium]